MYDDDLTFWLKIAGGAILIGGLIALACYFEMKAEADCLAHHGWWHVTSWMITKNGATPIYGCDYPPR
jgi:hypothetical protein